MFIDIPRNVDNIPRNITFLHSLLPLHSVSRSCIPSFIHSHLAVKENERIISRNKVNELVKEHKVFEKRCSRGIYVGRV